MPVAMTRYLTVNRYSSCCYYYYGDNGYECDDYTMPQLPLLSPLLLLTTCSSFLPRPLLPLSTVTLYHSNSNYSNYSRRYGFGEYGRPAIVRTSICFVPLSVNHLIYPLTDRGH